MSAFLSERQAAALAALVIGYFLFSAGVRSTYFVVATLALSIIVEQTVKSLSNITGGWNGLYVDRMTLTLRLAARAVAVRRCADVLHCSASWCRGLCRGRRR